MFCDNHVRTPSYDIIYTQATTVVYPIDIYNSILIACVFLLLYFTC